MHSHDGDNDMPLENFQNIYTPSCIQEEHLRILVRESRKDLAPRLFTTSQKEPSQIWFISRESYSIIASKLGEDLQMSMCGPKHLIAHDMKCTCRTPGQLNY